VVAHEAFASGRVDTGLIDRHRDVLFPPPGDVPERALVAAALAEFEALRARTADAARASVDAHSPWNAYDGWWPNRAPLGVAALFADGDARHATVVHPCGEGAARVVLPGRALDVTWTMRQGRLTIEAGDARFEASVVSDGEERLVFTPGTRRRLRLVDPLAHAGEVQEHAGHMAAPMSGAIVAVHVKPGDRVDKGAPLVVLEAMKMEHTIVAPAPGVVVAVNCAVGERVSEGADLVDLEDPPA
jgi:3-methylcrotonyl-CoA carboxylase alpha subunit